MLLFKQWQRLGRTGNQMFQAAFIYFLAKKYNCEYALPEWKYKDYFEYQHPIDKGIETTLTLTEPVFHYTPEYYDNFSKAFKEENVNLFGYFQSYKYFSSREDILKLFTFKKAFQSSILEKIIHLYK